MSDIRERVVSLVDRMAGDDTANKVEGALKHGEQKVEDLKEKIHDAAEATKDKAVEIAEVTKEKASELVDSLK